MSQRARVSSQAVLWCLTCVILSVAPCRQFAEACGQALDVNERLIKEDQLEYQEEMRSHYRDMLSELSTVMNEQVRLPSTYYTHTHTHVHPIFSLSSDIYCIKLFLNFFSSLCSSSHLLSFFPFPSPLSPRLSLPPLSPSSLFSSCFLVCAQLHRGSLSSAACSSPALSTTVSKTGRSLSLSHTHTHTPIQTHTRWPCVLVYCHCPGTNHVALFLSPTDPLHKTTRNGTTQRLLNGH